MHTDHKSTSILDNFYVNEAMLQYVEAAGPLHLGDNPSGHSPVMLSLKVGDIPRRPAEEEVRVPRRLAWSKAGEPKLNQYTEQLKEKLERLADPESLSCSDVKCQHQEHSQERDSHVLDIMTAWIEAGHATIPAAAAPTSGAAGKAGHVALPGWKENCGPARRDAKFWYSVWLSAGRPSTGELHRIMVSTRVKFRAAVRKTKAAANKLKASGFLQAAKAGDKMLLQEMRRVMGDKHEGQEIPDSLEGAVGHQEILEKFRAL